jgi:RNA recognition motif-containing protein
MTTTLYIGNLAWEVTSDDVFNLLVDFNTNPQSAEVVTSRSGRSQGYALAQFSWAQDAASAIEQLNETELHGRKIVVREDRGTTTTTTPKEKREVENVERAVNELSLYVGNLSWSTTEEQLAETFQHLNPTNVSLKYGRDGRSRGWALVTFQTGEEAQAALGTMHGYSVDGRELKCRLDEGAGLNSSSAVAAPAPKREREPREQRAPREPREPRGERETVFTADKSASIPPSPNTVYVGNLAWEVTNDDLFSLFVDHGVTPRTAEVAFSRSGRSQGYGLVVFSSAQDAANAVSQLNEVEYQGRNVVVREDRGVNRATKKPQNVDRAVNEMALFVGNLSWETTEDMISEEFKRFNPVETSLKLGRDGRSRGWALVSFGSSQDAQSALNAMNGVSIDGREIQCRFDRA